MAVYVNLRRIGQFEAMILKLILVVDVEIAYA